MGLYTTNTRDVVFAHYQQFVAVHLVVPEYFAEQDLLSPTLTSTGLTVGSLCSFCPGPGQDLPLIRFFGRGVGDDDARGGFTLLPNVRRSRGKRTQLHNSPLIDLRFDNCLP